MEAKLNILTLTIDRVEGSNVQDAKTAIEEVLGCSSAYILRWKERFEEHRLAGMFARHRGRRVEKRTPKVEAKILESA